MNLLEKILNIADNPKIKFLMKIIPQIFKKYAESNDESKDNKPTLDEQLAEIRNKPIMSTKIDGINIEVNDKAIEFWKKSYKILKKEGFNPLFVFVHIYHETGGFRHIIGKYNYWGIKARKDTINKVKVKTHEYIEGRRVECYAYFRDWETLKDAVNFYISLIRRLYPFSYKARNDSYAGYFCGLTNGKYKYATDPKYVLKLTTLYKKLTNDK